MTAANKYKPAEIVIQKAYNDKKPSHVGVEIHKEIAIFINTKKSVIINGTTHKFENDITTSNGTDSREQIATFYNSSTENAKIIDQFIKEAVESNRAIYKCENFLKYNAKEKACYLLNSPNVVTQQQDGSAVTSSNSNSLIVHPSSSKYPNTPIPKSNNNLEFGKAGIDYRSSAMFKWMELKFNEVATSSQIDSVSLKISSIEDQIKQTASKTELNEKIESVVELVDEAEHRVSAKIEHCLEKVDACENKLVEGSQANATEFSRLTEKIADLENKILLSKLTSNTHMSDGAILAAANQFASGTSLYWKAINANKRSGLFELVIMRAELYDTVEPTEGQDKATFNLNYKRLNKLFKQKISVVDSYPMRISAAGNLVCHARVVGNSGNDTQKRLQELINIKNTIKHCYISLVTPIEFDISAILENWISEGTVIKFVTAKSGGVTVFVNDGEESGASGEIEAVTAVKTDLKYLETCSRINVSNPHAIACLEDASIKNLRKIAEGEHFVTGGIIRKFPDNFRRKPRNPGFVNLTWKNADTGEFNVSDDSDEDSDNWED